MSIHLTAQLAALAVIVALLPLSVVWAAADTDRFRKLVAVTLFLTFDLIVFGGFTRLTDSGLGCPDWPGCYGHANPLQASAAIAAAEAAMPEGPVTVAKAWIEMIHRYLAMAVGVLIVALTIIAWRRWWKNRGSHPRAGVNLPHNMSISPWIPTFLLGFVCLQGAFGAWTVTMKLQPIIVTIHLMLALTLLGLLTWFHARQKWPAARPDVSMTTQASPVVARLALGLLIVQIALGGWVSTNYAALACTDFPLCHGVWFPDMNFTEGFTLWRKLGMTSGGEFLPFPALTAIHWVHRNFAFFVGSAVLWAACRALRNDSTRILGKWLFGAIAMQFLTGLATIYLQWPLALAVLHNAGAALLVLLLVMLNYRASTSTSGRDVFVGEPPLSS